MNLSWIKSFVAPSVHDLFTHSNTVVTISTIQKTSENTAVMYRRIGSTTYKVTVHFDEAERETITDKIVRLIGNETLDKSQECGIIEMPQMSRQPERSAL